MHRGPRIALLSVSLSALFLFAGPSRDAYAGDAVDVAHAHFDAGKKLRDDGDCVRAIPEFDKSLAADKSIGAYYNLGFCHEQLGHKQDAHEAYKHAQQLASMKKDDRLREISGALASLLETSAHVRLVLPQQLPEGIQITVDDQLVPEAYYATEMVVFTKNGASHTIVVTAPGWEDRRELVANKAIKAIELRRTQPKDALTAPPPPPASAEAPHSWKTLHYVSVGFFGGGVVAAGVGTFLLFNHLSRLNDIETNYKAEKLQKCGSQDDGSSCVQGVTKDRNQQVTNENTRASIVVIGSYGVAFALLLSGTILFLTVPTTASPSETKATAAATRMTTPHAVRFTPIIPTKEKSGVWGGALVGTF